ncbi:hypothetical protein [Halodesulfovibrio sp.]|uniref:hypothetical protein n=1 Tax=Halodesulfovibrio sp. TaxID=1912772 RepID=UPI0025E57EDF|nr:hypothetical protein [Halodesulfovibrio sp.]MCT4628031.1 hypothetical protein [Halodesulfovibrio sp.]
MEKKKKSPNHSTRNIDIALQNLLELPSSDHLPDTYQLLFRLYAAISLQEYSFRVHSNKFLANFVYSTEIKMEKLYKARIKSFGDKDVLSHLLGYKVKKITANLRLQAEFVKHIILTYSVGKPSSITERFGSMNFQIIMAMIMHHEKCKIKIPSKIKGISDVPNSVTSILKDAVSYAKNNSGEFPPLSRYSEALVMYWEMRYHLLVNALMSEDIASGVNRMQKIAELELLVDDKLVQFFSYKDSSAFHALPELPSKFAKLLGYEPGKYIDIESL